MASRPIDRLIVHLRKDGSVSHAYWETTPTNARTDVSGRPPPLPSAADPNLLVDFRKPRTDDYIYGQMTAADRRWDAAPNAVVWLVVGGLVGWLIGRGGWGA